MYILAFLNDKPLNVFACKIDVNMTAKYIAAVPILIKLINFSEESC